MGKVKEGSKLLAALGKTKKEQMKAIMPAGVKKSRTSTSVKSKAPYTRGNVMAKINFYHEERQCQECHKRQE